MNRPAQIAKERAEIRRALEAEIAENNARHARIRRRTKRCVYGFLAVASAFVLTLIGYAIPRDMELPPVGDPVIVRTATRWHMAYLDEAGEFRQVWTGERIGQVTQWKRP